MPHKGASAAVALLTLNISGPSVGRARSLADFLLGLGSDVVVLTETRSNAGTRQLLDDLVGAGYTSLSPLPPAAGERGVAVLSRLPLRGVQLPASVDLPHRLVVADMGEGTRLIAAYVPSRDASAPKIERKRRFLAQMLGVVERSAADAGDVILIGDFNIVGREHEPRYSAFRSWEYDALDRLGSLGMVDAFTLLHPGLQAHSWIGRTGNGYRYDYAFVSEGLANQVRACEYAHEPRERSLSDHAALSLQVGVRCDSIGLVAKVLA